MIIRTLEQLEAIRCRLSNQNLEIPNIIHQTWKNNQIPSHWKSSKQAWIELHPKWFYILWTDRMNLELVKRFYSELLEKYQNYQYNIQRVDFIRPLILYRYGGIYSDLDLKPLRSFEILFGSSKYSNSIEVFLLSNNGRYTNMLMISKPKTHFWIQVIKEMKNPRIPSWVNISRHFYILHTTGPYVINRVVSEYDGIIGYLPSKLMQPCSVCDPKPCSVPNAYLEMLDGSSLGRLDSIIIIGFVFN